MSIETIQATDGVKEIRLWTTRSEVEPQALAQLQNVARLPWVFHHVAVMADVHHGKGCTVGSVIAMKDAVSPAAVGVDLSCGMAAMRTNLQGVDLPSNLEPLRSKIEEMIPVGFNSHIIDARYDTALFERFNDLDPGVQSLETRARSQVGTLGGGNHFIELCLDEIGDVWMMLHSGSRNIGKSLAEIHIERARKLAHNADLPDPDLAVFLAKTPEMAAYLHDVKWAQEYAFLNRLTMIDLFASALRSFFPTLAFPGRPIMCHHNYISEETHFGEDIVLTRKGAIDAHRGVMGIIPGSMGAASFIVRGKGSEESFCSASHGAGRRMSRGAAKRHFTVADLEEQTRGVECRKDAGVIDEAPLAYKDIRVVMNNQHDLVEIVHELKQVLSVKG